MTGRPWGFWLLVAVLAVGAWFVVAPAFGH